MVEIRIREVSFWRGNEFVIMNMPVFVINGRCYAYMSDKRLHLVGKAGRILNRVAILTQENMLFFRSINLEIAA